MKNKIEKYRKAAEQGNVMAQNSLGWCYYFGKGVTQDYTEALKWYRKAVNLGGVEADFKIWLIEKCHKANRCSKCR